MLEADFDFIMGFWDCPKPTIAAVHGYCIGGAFELSLACDITVAREESTKFGAPEVKFGSGAVALLLPWIAGPKAAKELLLTGEDKLDGRARLGARNRQPCLYPTVRLSTRRSRSRATWRPRHRSPCA